MSLFKGRVKANENIRKGVEADSSNFNSYQENVKSFSIVYFVYAKGNEKMLPKV